MGNPAAQTLQSLSQFDIPILTNLKGCIQGDLHHP